MSSLQILKSFCIKTNNQKIINYLLKSFENFPINNIYFISKKFKNFQNVIIHYRGSEVPTFCNILSDILSETIIIFYEPLIIRKFINNNYFYFEDYEKKLIEKSCFDYISLDEDHSLAYRKDEIWPSFYQYIINNKSIILDGFVNFRIPDYLITLDYVVDNCVNNYIIDKEYTEFINLLKLYIDSKEPQVNIVHLIYLNNESILLDESKQIIPADKSKINAKYLSDITFSSNDYALNSLLTLLPKKIVIHLIDNKDDEFINTLKSIFGKRISICKECSICNIYKYKF